MKIDKVNVAGIDMSDSEECEVSFSDISFEKLVVNLKELLKSFKEQGVTEIGELSVSGIDLSGAEKATVRQKKEESL